MTKFSAKFLARFWRKVDKTSSPTGCWLWIGFCNPHDGGYGQVRLKGKTAKVHRVSWEIHKGKIPKGKQVLHNCPGGDNPHCINPEHLWSGTQLQNIRDMVRKNRHHHPSGERNGRAKLTEQDVLNIRTAYATGLMNGLEVAAKYKISKFAAYAVLERRTWRHVK